MGTEDGKEVNWQSCAIQSMREYVESSRVAGVTLNRKEAAALLAELARLKAIEVKADQLWRICVEYDFPWSDGDTQDQLAELGMLYVKDMTKEDSGPECENCIGDCEQCYCAVENVREAK